MSTRITEGDGIMRMPDSGERAAMSVVWTTLPAISHLIPLIGHVGIGDSQGIIFDFSAPFQITVSALMYGPAKRVWKLDSTKIMTATAENVADKYDAAIAGASAVFGKKMHKIVYDNCHSYVALVLNRLEYDGKTNWNQVTVFKEIWLHGRWVNRKEPAIVFGPCAILLLLIVLCAILVPLLTK